MKEQAEAIRFLKAPGTLGGADPPEIITTHISVIFLTDELAFKLKRSVRLPYVDFSTPELRLSACRKEAALNSKTAPSLYRRVRVVTREKDGSLALDGPGELLDAILEMRRFDQSLLFDSMAKAGTLSNQLITQTAQMIAHYHKEAPVIHIGGGAANLEDVLDMNMDAFAQNVIFTQSEIIALDEAFRARLDHHRVVLDQREEIGKVRRCHGDLHLRNVCLLNGKPCLFDCIEFNDRIATVDVLYDLAFLLMDLWHHGLHEQANVLANRYFDEAGDDEAFVLLPFFMAMRAAVRAHVTGTQATEIGDPSGALHPEAKAYVHLAFALLKQPLCGLVAIGGLSGTGKTTIAEELASHIGPPPGARILESDRIRKSLHGVSAETLLPNTAYAPRVSEAVYDEMASRAAAVLATGGSVIANGVFLNPSERTRVEDVASNLNRTSFIGLWLEAPANDLRHRISHRQGGSSDATVSVLTQQLERDPGEIAWQRVDATRRPPDIVSDLLQLPGIASLRHGPTKPKQTCGTG